VIFIDFGYSLNAALVEFDEQNRKFLGCENEGMKYKSLILFISVILYGGVFAAIGVMYAMWPLAGCAFNTLAITTTLLFGLLNTAISLSNIAEHGSILCSGIIFAYSTWLCYATLSASPAMVCNPNASDVGDHVGTTIVSCLVAGVSIAYIAFRMGSKEIGRNAMAGGASKAPSLELGDQGEQAGSEGEAARNDQVTVHVAGEKQNNDSSELLPDDVSWGVYHFKMFMICMYMSMLLTDWGVAGSDSTQKYSIGYASCWLQMSVNWVCCLLYFWTLIAAKCCPDRDFS
jgi:hypothetical protein